MLYSFDSVEQFADRCGQFPAWVVDNLERQSLDWCGGLTFAETLGTARHGDDSLVPRAEALLDKLEASIEVRAYQTRADVCGSRVCVPDYLSGSPTSMRRRARCQSEVSPITVWVSLTSSWNIDAETMLRRGVAILALLIKLERLRPVQLRLITELDGVADGNHVQVIPVESQPLNLSTACFALTAVGFDRLLCHGYAYETDGYAGSWCARKFKAGYVAWLRQHVGMQPQDLYIEAAKSGDAMLADPVAWVNAQVRKTQEENEP